MRYLLILFVCFGCSIDLHENKMLVDVNNQGNGIEGLCVDHAVAKKELLAKQGIESYLATAWVRPVIETPGDKGFTNKRLSSELQYHMVCVVHTNEGNFILDNYHQMVYHPSECWYEWDVMQTDDGWRKIIGVVKTKHGSRLLLGKEVIPPLMNLKRK